MAQAASATPLAIVESYFDVQLDKSGLKHLDKVPSKNWFEFSKYYLATMERDFVPQFLHTPDDGGLVRLYFEPQLRYAWDKAVSLRHRPTPLLGLQPDPKWEVTPETVSQMLGPLAKHLLVADSVFVRDSFYVCFDSMADSFSRLDSENVRDVEFFVARIKAWLPLLAELRALIESRALVFMPYYVTPSFPYTAHAPQLKEPLKRLRIRGTPGPADGRQMLASLPADFKFNFKDTFDPQEGAKLWAAAQAADKNPRYLPVSDDEVIGAWLNAKILGLDPVFPNRPTFDLASSLYFAGDEGPTEITSDLISMDILPFGDSNDIRLKDLVKMRKNEEVFATIRQTVTSCKQHLDKELGPGSSRHAITAVTEKFLKDELTKYERKSVLKFIKEKDPAGIGYSLALGATLLAANVFPPAAVVAAAVLTPDLGQRAVRRFRRKTRAIAHLQALL